MPPPRNPRVAELIEGSRRAARTRDCPRCGRPTIVGDDHDEVALVATVDADILTPFAEMLAVLDGRLTFELLPMRGKEARHGSRALWHRDDWQLHSARPVRGTVHRLHRCDPQDREAHEQCPTPTLFPT